MSDTTAPMQFNQFLIAQRAGLAHAELTDALAAVTAAVIEHGKAGALTLKITIKPSGAGDGRSVFITDAIAVKAPSGERPAALFFADEDGRLSRNDPRQPELPLRTAERPPLRDAKESTQ